MKKILVLHGPNLNLLGTREPEIYGPISLNSIDADLTKQAELAGVMLTCVQSNSEERLIECVHQAFYDKVDYIIINPAAFTHTSIALRDALSSVSIPFIEIHLSNIYAREPFRRHSWFSEIAEGVISGLGAQGYSLALQTIVTQLKQRD